MKFRKMMMLAAFVIAVGSAFATTRHSNLVNNRRINAGCVATVDNCNDSGPNTCTQDEYLLNDTNCQTRQFQKP